MRLKDRVAIVTGGGRGIGRDIALAYAREGARVVVAEIDAVTAEATAKEAGGIGVQVDVAKSADIKRVVERTISEFGQVDILVNNAMKIVPYFMLGQFTSANLLTSIALLPVAIAANMAGIWLVRRTPTGLFYQIAYALLLVISVALLWQGFSGVLHR